MLFLIAIDMVFEKRTERRENRAEEVVEDAPVDDVSVFPMAIPMIAGPGSIASVDAADGAQRHLDGDVHRLGRARRHPGADPDLPRCSPGR